MHGAPVRIVCGASYRPLPAPAVADESFWEGLEPVHFGGLPRLQDSVTVIGCVFDTWILKRSCVRCFCGMWKAPLQHRVTSCHMLMQASA